MLCIRQAQLAFKGIIIFFIPHLKIYCDYNYMACHNCEIMKKKVILYERFFEEMKKLEEEMINKLNLEESVIVERDMNGYTNKKIRSNLTESFLVIDKGKDLTRLSQKEQNALKSQDNLRVYTKVKDKVGIVGTVLGYFVSIGQWLAIL